MTLISLPWSVFWNLSNKHVHVLMHAGEHMCLEYLYHVFSLSTSSMDSLALMNLQY